MKELKTPHISIICTLFILCFIGNAILHADSLWSLYIIPMMLLVIKYPSNIVANGGMGIVAIGKLYHCHFYNEFDDTSIYIILTTILINWLIVIIFTYFVTKNLAFKKDLEKLIIIDPLTKLYNRRYLDQISNNIHDKYPLSMILLDIDYFKNINDKYGHEFGDRVLKKIASTLQYNLRENDSAIRIGGEEFMIILPETDIHTAMLIANRIRELISIQNMVFREGSSVPVTISLGVGSLKNEDTFNSLFIRSDNALYEAKRTGRNRVVKE